MKKRICAFLMTAAMLFSLTACGGSGSGGDAAADSGSTGGSTDTLEVMIWDNNQLAGLQQIADEWSAESGIKVNFQVVTWDEYWTLLEAGASGGQMPDVFWMHSNVAQMYMENDMLLKLNDYIDASEEIDMANYYEGITNMYKLDDAQYAIPKDHDTIALIYNKAIFDQYGVEYPTNEWTWDDFYNAAKTITEASGGSVYGAAMNTTNDQDSWYNIVYSYGGGVISEDGTTSMLDDPKTLEAMEFLGKMIDDCMPPQSVLAESGTDVLFNSGTVAMITQGSWMVKTFYASDNKDDYAWAMIPYYDRNGNGTCEPEERCTIYNGLGWAAAANTPDPDAAWSLIEWFSTEANQIKQSELGVTMAGYIGASDAFASAFEGMDISPFVDVEEQGTLIFYPHSRNTTIWNDMLKTSLVTAWNDTSKMTEVVTQCAADMNAALAKE